MDDLPVREYEQEAVNAIPARPEEQADSFTPAWSDVPFGVKKGLYSVGRDFLRRYEVGGDYEELAQELSLSPEGLEG